MDFENFLQSLLSLLKNGDNLYYVVYAVATCLLTQIFKKIFVNKIKVDVLHKIDFAVFLPFIFGVIFGAVDMIFVRHASFSFDFVVKTVVSAATIGALASVIFKFCASLSGQSLKSLLKDDIFGAFYSQLLYFGTVREQLLAKEITFKDFLSQVKLVASNAVVIYRSNVTETEKKEKLARLLVGIVDDSSISTCLETLHGALMKLNSPNTEKADATTM